MQAARHILMKDASNERLVGNALFIGSRLDVHEIGRRKTNVYASAFNESSMCGLAKPRELRLRRMHGNQCTLFVGTQYFAFITVKSFHLNHPFLDRHASPSGSE